MWIPEIVLMDQNCCKKGLSQYVRWNPDKNFVSEKDYHSMTVRIILTVKGSLMRNDIFFSGVGFTILSLNYL